MAIPISLIVLDITILDMATAVITILDTVTAVIMVLEMATAAIMTTAAILIPIATVREAMEAIMVDVDVDATHTLNTLGVMNHMLM